MAGIVDRWASLWGTTTTPSGSVGPAHVDPPPVTKPTTVAPTGEPGPPQPGYPYRAANGDLICCENFHGYTVKVQNMSVNIYDPSGNLWVGYAQGEIMDRIGTYRRIRNGASANITGNEMSLPRALPNEVVAAIKYALTPKMQSGQALY